MYAYIICERERVYHTCIYIYSLSTNTGYAHEQRAISTRGVPARIENTGLTEVLAASEYSTCVVLAVDASHTLTLSPPPPQLPETIWEDDGKGGK